MRQSLRVAVVAESFLPSLNGVTNSVCRVLEHLRLRGHEAVVVCPAPAPARFAGFEVVTVPAFSYRQFPVGLPSWNIPQVLEAFDPDVVHVASPFVLGAAGLLAAKRLGVPSVAIYQTDVAGFARRNRVGLAASAAWRWIRRVHDLADVTLAPSGPALADLRAHGIPRTALWGRGVDTALFRPDRPGAALLHQRIATDGEVVVGYVGRLAPEKQVERLAALEGLENVRLLVVGDGPARPSVEKALGRLAATPVFLGRLEGEALADAYGALDVFVHTGTEETFGQTIQEAQASGLPVVAPAAGGPLDLVRHGADGYLYGAGDDEALRAAVGSLVDDPLRRAAFGAAGRRQVLPRSWEAIGDQLIDHYASVVAAHRGSLVRAA